MEDKFWTIIAVKALVVGGAALAGAFRPAVPQLQQPVDPQPSSRAQPAQIGITSFADLAPPQGHSNTTDSGTWI